LSASTIPAEHWTGRFDFFAALEWPSTYRCCTVDAEDGSFRVWGPKDGVPAQLAVAASCAVPLLYPPVHLADRHWIDGGVRDMLNADVAAGADAAVVVSCTLLELPWRLPLPYLDDLLAVTRRRVDVLRAAARAVVTVVPGAEMLEVSEWGLALMDFSRTGAAYQAGISQAKVEADRIALEWR
jgi:NTE family protein